MSKLDPVINNGKPIEIKIDDPVIIDLIKAGEQLKACEKDPDSQLCFKSYLKYKINNDVLEVYAMTLADKPFEHADQFPNWLEISTFHPLNSQRKVFPKLMEIRGQKYDRIGIKLGSEFQVQIKSTLKLEDKTIKNIITEIQDKPHNWLTSKYTDENGDKYFLMTKFNNCFTKPHHIDFTMQSSLFKD